MDISQVMKDVDYLLDQSVAPMPFVIEDPDEKALFDLNQIDFEELNEKFSTGKKRTESEKLRAMLNQKLESMVAKNPSRTDFIEKLQKLIEKYNSGSVNIEAFFQQLMAFTEELQEEDQRAIREGLTDEELALFDIIIKPVPEMTDKEVARMQAMCQELLETLKKEKREAAFHHLMTSYYGDGQSVYSSAW